MQIELTQPGSLLSGDGSLTKIGWARQPLLDANLESARFYRLHCFQRFRIKRWDYYAVFTPISFISATIADLGYAGNIFVYIMDLETASLHEEGLVVPLAKGIKLPRISTEGSSHFENHKVHLDFDVSGNKRKIMLTWPQFLDGKGIEVISL